MWLWRYINIVFYFINFYVPVLCPGRCPEQEVLSSGSPTARCPSGRTQRVAGTTTSRSVWRGRAPPSGCVGITEATHCTDGEYGDIIISMTFVLFMYVSFCYYIDVRVQILL